MTDYWNAFNVARNKLWEAQDIIKEKDKEIAELKRYIEHLEEVSGLHLKGNPMKKENKQGGDEE